MKRPAAGGYLAPILFVAVGIGALFLPVVAESSPRPLTLDERDYLSAASNLARHRVLSSARPTDAAPAPDAYREPGYPALLALSWRFAPDVPPASAAELEAFARSPERLTALVRLNVLLLLSAAAAAGALVARLAGGAGGALAFLLVAASPALQVSARFAAAENLAAPLVALATLALVAAIRGGSGAVLLAGVAVGLLPLVRATGGAAIAAGTLVLALAGSRRSGSTRAGRLGRAALYLAVAMAPTVAWQLRNLAALDQFISSDRGGLALAVRAELDREVERHGVLIPALAWTPLEAAHREAERRAPGARIDRPIWSGEGNFFSRVVAPWRKERAAGADPLALDRRFRREAFASFAERPLAHLAATAVVAWRALFVERSPEWATPLDLRLLFGFLFVAAFAGVALPALRGRDGRLAAFLAPAAALFAFHALATEFLPRYALPLLPVAWAAVALVLSGGVQPVPELTPRRAD